MSTRNLRRAATAAACIASLATAAPAPALAADTVSPSPATATTDYSHRGALAARWQASQLTAGRIHNGQYDFDDWGLTVDTGFMLAADGTRPVALARLERAVERNYFAHYSFRGTSSGALAKTLLFARVVRSNVRDFGGRNLRAAVLRHVEGADAGFERGRVTDSGANDYSNVVGQSYAVLGLARTGGMPQRVVSYLLKQRCPAGYFRLYPVIGKTCGQANSTPDVDATALALQALLSARQHGAAASGRAIKETANWLDRVAQRPNGSFGGGFTTADSNSNSTGLAANALAATDHRSGRIHAAAWVASLQITKARADNGPARTDIGAIAYRPAALRRALRDGIGVTKRDQFRRATPQAYFALAPAPFNRLLAPR